MLSRAWPGHRRFLPPFFGGGIGGGATPPSAPPWALQLEPAPGRIEPSRRLVVLWDQGLLQPTGPWKQYACEGHAPAAVELQATGLTRTSSETRHESSKAARPLRKCVRARIRF